MLRLDPGQRRDRASLVEKLRLVQTTARKRKHPQLVNITLGVGHTDPLGVLQSIQDADSPHLFLECPQGEEALAGEGELIGLRCQGETAWTEAANFVEHWKAESTLITEEGFFRQGPHWLFTAPFAIDGTSSDPAFAEIFLFLPRWMVAKTAGGYSAMANVLVDPNTDLEMLARKIEGAHARFREFDYGALPLPEGTPELLSRNEVGEGSYQDRVRAGLAGIEAGRYRKIVLARAVDETFSSPVDGLAWCHHLRQRFPACITYAFGNGRGQSFLGATPESLVRTRGGRFFTEAIAGSAARGSNAREDASLAQELLRSEKDLREHQLVVESIKRRLSLIDLKADRTGNLRLIQLANVQHLHTTVEGSLPKETHFFDLVSTLHPTPATGGSPREKALPDIARLEPFPRGLYAGLAGWFNPEGDGAAYVLLRAARLDKSSVRFYAGAGIVEGSDPEKEWRETELKLDALRQTL